MLFFTPLPLCLLPCSSRISLAGTPLRRCLLTTTRWATSPMTTKERWTCMLRPSPRLWGWIWPGSLRPGVGPLKQPLRRASPPCLPGVTIPWLSMTECQTAANEKSGEMGSINGKLLPLTNQWVQKNCSACIFLSYFQLYEAATSYLIEERSLHSNVLVPITQYWHSNKCHIGGFYNLILKLSETPKKHFISGSW